ncbi:MAG TPA: K(+)-transporting ATPase subunit F [Gemmatimonadales bacterium]
MSAEAVIGAVITVALVGYLVYTMLRPERF